MTKGFQIIGPRDKRIRRTRCEACLRRRRKCYGGRPCYYCRTTQQPCSSPNQPSRDVFVNTLSANKPHDDSTGPYVSQELALQPTLGSGREDPFACLPVDPHPGTHVLLDHCTYGVHMMPCQSWGKLKITNMMPTNEGTDASKRSLSSLIPETSTSQHAGARVRLTAPSNLSKRWLCQDESHYIGPVTSHCQTACLDYDGCCSETVSREDCQESASTASLSNNVVHQSNQDASSPLPLIDPFYSGPLDPFATYPSVFPPEIVNSCLVYRMSISAQFVPSHGNLVTYWLLAAKQDQILFIATLFHALSHKRIRWVLSGRTSDIFGPQDQHWWKLCYMESIKLLNGAIQDLEYSMTDAVIMSVLIMAYSTGRAVEENRYKGLPFQAPLQNLQWLHILGAQEADPAHVSGLRGLISLKGGLDKIKVPGVRGITSYLDTLHAAKTLSIPQFAFYSLSGRRIIALDEVLAFTAVDIENSFGQLRNVGLNSELVKIFQAMKLYTSMLEAYIDGSLVEPDLSKFCDQRNLIQHQLMSLPSADKLSGISLREKQVYEVCRVSGIIYNIGVIFPLPDLTTPLPTLSRTLKHNLQTCDLNLYLPLTDLTDLFLWAITIGGIAATGTHERAWFVKSLKRLAAAAQMSRWSDLKQSLDRILWLDSACDVAGQQVWYEAEQHLISSERCPAKPPQPTTTERPVQNVDS